MPRLRPCAARGHADGCVSVFLRVHPLQNVAQTEGRRLLRVLFLRIGRLSSHSSAAQLLFGNAKVGWNPHSIGGRLAGALISGSLGPPCQIVGKSRKCLCQAESRFAHGLAVRAQRV